MGKTERPPGSGNFVDTDELRARAQEEALLSVESNNLISESEWEQLRAIFDPNGKDAEDVRNVPREVVIKLQSIEDPEERKEYLDLTAKKQKEIPPELKGIFGEKVPRDVLGLYRKLDLKKKPEYIAHLKMRAEEDKSKKQSTLEVVRPAHQEEFRRTEIDEVAATPAVEVIPEVEAAREAMAKHGGVHYDILKKHKGSGKENKIAVTPEIEVPMQEQSPASLDAVDNEVIGKEAIAAAVPEAFRTEAPLPEVLEFESVYPKAESSVESAEESVISEEEHTPKEWKAQMRALIEKSEARNQDENLRVRFEKMRAYLDRLEAKEAAEAAHMGKLEQGFRWLGEQYNKAGFKTKLAVGLALGIGGGVALSAGSFATAAALLGGVATQRAAGMASMFLKFEKTTSDETWFGLNKKEKAMGKALGYYVASMGVMYGLVEGVKEGVDYAEQQGWGESVKNWLGQFWAPEHVAGAHQEVSGKIHMAPAHEAPAAAPAPVETTVPAQPEQPYPAVAPEDSNALHVETIRTPDGMLRDVLVNKDGDYISAIDVPYAEDGSATIPYPETHAWSATNMHPIEAPADTAPAPEVAAPDTSAVTPEAPATQAPAPVVDHSFDSNAQPEAATQSPAPIAEHSWIDNKFGVSVAMNEPHIYTDGKHLLVYGGTPIEQQAKAVAYLTEHPNAVVYGPDNAGEIRAPFSMVDGRVLPGAPVKTSGFLGFFSSFMKPPAPDEFTKIVE